MDVTFETPCGRQFTIEVGYFDTVLEMKEKIERYENIPVGSQRLFFQGQELADDRDTEHYSILQGSHVLLLLPPDPADPAAAAAAASSPAAETPSSSCAVHVLVSIPATRRHFAVDVDASDTVARLKELVQEHTDGGLPAARQAVFYNKAEMQDQRALADYCPLDQMEVSVVARQPQPQSPVSNAGGGNSKKQLRMAVQVKCGAQTVSVEVSAADNVGELRKELGRMAAGQQGQPGFQLPGDDGYFFIYKQNVMEDDRSFRWHDVKNGDTIEIFNGSVTGGS